MKKILFVLFLILSLLSACQTRSEPEPAAQVTSGLSVTEAPQPAATQPEPTATSFPPTPTPLPPTQTPALLPTPTQLPEALAGSIDDLVGTWKGRWSDSTSIYLEIKEGSAYRVLFPDGEEIASGLYNFEDGVFKFRTDSGPAAGYCDPHADYEVYVTKQGDQIVALRFALIGEDDCIDRKDFMDGKILIILEP